MNLLTQDPITFWFRRTRRWKLSRATRLLRGDKDGRGLADTLRQIRMMRTIRPTSSAAALVPRQRSNQLHSRAFLFFFFCVVVIVRLCQVAALGLNRDRTHARSGFSLFTLWSGELRNALFEHFYAGEHRFARLPQRAHEARVVERADLAS